MCPNCAKAEEFKTSALITWEDNQRMIRTERARADAAEAERDGRPNISHVEWDNVRGQILQLLAEIASLKASLQSAAVEAGIAGVPSELQAASLEAIIVSLKAEIERLKAGASE